MDSFERLKIEYNGIKDVITAYSSRGNIKNFLSELGSALEVGNGEAILYCLEEIDNWYTMNISSIYSNHYVTNIDEHERNRRLIKTMLEELKEYNFSLLEPLKGTEYTTPQIFLSHCSVNKKYGDALERLFMSLGVKANQLIYTSHPLHKIPLGVNIYDYLRENINKDVFVVILWSNEYLDSPACLNEMGAAWIVQSDYTNIYVPDFDFGNPKYHQCAVDTRKMGAVLNGNSNCKASMIEFKDRIIELFNLSIDEQEWTVILDEFIKNIS